MNTAAAILILLVALVLWCIVLRQEMVADFTPPGLDVASETSVTNATSLANVQTVSGHKPTNNVKPSQ